MEAAEPVLKTVWAAVRAGGPGGAAAFAAASSQLRLLGGAAGRAAPAPELAEELLERAETLAGSKQVRAGRRWDVCSRDGRRLRAAAAA